MSSDETMSIELAKLAVSLLPHVETSISLPDRLKQAAQMASRLQQYTHSALDHASRKAQNENVQKTEEFYGRPWDEIQALTEDERAKIDYIAKCFRDVAGAREEIPLEEFLEKVLLPGRRHAIKTLLASWEGYEDDVGQKLPLNLSTATLHGTNFLREFEKKKSTWMKRIRTPQVKKAGKKGGLKKAAQERKLHG